MSTLKLENIKHENSSTNTLVLDSDGSIAIHRAIVGTSVDGTDGLTVNGTATISNVNGSSYNENLRLPRSNIGWSAIAMNTTPNLGSGYDSAQWTMVGYPTTTSITTTPKAWGLRYGGGSNAVDDVIYARSNKTVAFPHQPFLLATKTASQDLTSTSATLIIFNDKIHDATNAYDTSTGVFTCPASGIYTVQPKAWFGSGSYGTIKWFLVKNNGIVQEARATRTNSISEFHTFQPTFTINCSANDALKLEAESNTNATFHTSSTIRYSQLVIKMEHTDNGG